ncbi:MAG: transketolase C-terminal domain-containing protein [Atribacterota bacterium]|nr:transketolase C-terminal domain-containing protein [Atribacterota bacterium]
MIDQWIATREAFGETLKEMGGKYKDIVVFEADVSKSTKTCEFAKSFPNRFFNMGVAEQNMFTAAAGLSTTGLIPFVSTYAVFAAYKACEQIRTFIAYPELNVKITVSHGGLTPGKDGVTHQATEDLSIMRSIPNLTVVMPADAVATRSLVEKAYHFKGPVYLRFTKCPVPVIYPKNDKNFHFGKARIVKEGKKISLIAIGDMVYQALQAAKELEKDGINARVVDMYSLKPLDYDCLKRIASDSIFIVTIEDNTILGGLGSAVCEFYSEYFQLPVYRIGLQDTFAESGEYHELLDKYGLSSKAIVLKVKSILNC